LNVTAPGGFKGSWRAPSPGSSPSSQVPYHDWDIGHDWDLGQNRALGLRSGKAATQAVPRLGIVQECAPGHSITFMQPNPSFSSGG
jgi:hypothetical protein